MGTEKPRQRSSYTSSTLSRSRHKTSESLDRKTSVHESLTKYLDDVDDEDSFLIGDLVDSRQRKQGSSRSHHTNKHHRDEGSSSHRDGLNRSRSERGSRSSRPERSKSDSHKRRTGSSSHSKSSRGSSKRNGERKPRSQSEHSRPHSRTGQSLFSAVQEGENEEEDNTYASDDDSFAGETPPPPQRKQSHHTDPMKHRKKSSDRPKKSRSQQHIRQPDHHDHNNGGYDDSFGSEDMPRPTLSPKRATSDISGLAGSLDRQIERENRKATFKAAYRDASSVVSGYSHSRLGDDRSIGTSATSLTSTSNLTRKSSRVGRTTNVDGGPLSHLLNQNKRSSQRKNTLGSHFAENGGDDDAASIEEQSVMSEQWVQQRSRNQDAILNQAKQDRWEKEAQEDEKRRGSVSHIPTVNEDGGDVFNGDDDDDQPRVKQKSNALDQVFRTVRKTAGVTRSAAKGSVNAVKDPKRAAKNLGGLTKNVAKGTVNAVLDPTKTAKRVGKVTKTGVFGTVNIATGVTAFTAKAGFSATKAVAKTGMGATTMVVGATTDGLGKVVHGVHGLIAGGHDVDEGDQYADYHAKNLPERRKNAQSLMDRITNVVEEKRPEEADDVPPVDGGGGDSESKKKASAEEKLFKKGMARRSKGLSAGSMLVPIATDLGRKGNASYDVSRPEY